MKLLSLPYFNAVKVHALLLKIKYGFGAKFPDIDDFTPDAIRVDCSGFFRWFIWHASGQSILFPDGSQNQNAHCKALGLTIYKYHYAAMNRTGAAFACFFPPTKKRAGHVWIIRNGKTIESFGGKGIASRSALTPVLLLGCKTCYRIL